MVSMLDKIKSQIENISKDELLFKRWDLGHENFYLKNIISFRYSHTQPYYFELNPSFVAQYRDIEAMLSFKFVMLRDGFWGLYYLFLKNTVLPKYCDTIFLIPLKFSRLVPPAWKKNVLFYQFKYKQFEIKEQLLIYGCPYTEVQLKQEISTNIMNAIQNSPKITYLHTGISYRGNSGEINISYANEIIREIYSLKGVSQTNIIEGFSEEIIANFNDTFAFRNLDADHFIIYDDYLTQLFAAKGMSNLNKIENDQAKNSKLISSYALSFYHQIDLYQDNCENEEILQWKVEAKLKGLNIDFSNPSFYHDALSHFSKY
jgi:hypothetical protein